MPAEFARELINHGQTEHRWQYREPAQRQLAVSGNFAPYPQRRKIQRRMRIARQRRDQTGIISVVKGIALVHPETLLANMKNPAQRGKT